MGEFMLGFIGGSVITGCAVGWVAGLIVRRIRQEGTARLGGILQVVDSRGGYRPVRKVDRDVVVPPRGPSAVVPLRRCK